MAQYDTDPYADPQLRRFAKLPNWGTTGDGRLTAGDPSLDPSWRDPSLPPLDPTYNPWTGGVTGKGIKPEWWDGGRVSPAVEPTRFLAGDTVQPPSAPVPLSTPPPTTSTYAPIQGFDFTKLSTGGGSAGKYTGAVRTFSQGLGSGVPVARGQLGPMVAYAKANGFGNAVAVGDDKIDFGDGNGPIDVVQSNGSIWFQNGADRFAGPGGAAPGAAAGGAGLAVAGVGSSALGSANPNTGRANALYDLLMQRAGQSLDVNPDDPIIRRQSDAYGAQQERSRRDYLASVAEREGDNANIGAETRRSAEQVGQSTGAFEAQLMGQELSARRQEIRDALNGAMGFLTNQQQLQLQEELAQLELALRQYQFGANLGQEESQFGRTLAQRAFEADQTDAWRNSPLYG